MPFPVLSVGIGAMLLTAAPAQGQTLEDIQRQIDELKATIAEIRAAQQAAMPPVAVAAPAPVDPLVPVIAPPKMAGISPAPATPPWYDRIKVRGDTRLRLGEIVSGDRAAPDGIARLRSVHDGGIGDDTGFAFRRIRLVLQGDVGDRISFYLQPDFATGVAAQSVGERREGFLQLRDA